MPEPSQLVASAAGLMKGGGYYNRHGWMQAAGVTAALPALARAAAAVPIELPLIVADYGSSQGRNSLRPMQVAIEGLRARASNVPITVVHIDQPGNDFSSLFALLNSSPDSYLQMHPENYAAAIGRSFFEPVLPPASVTLGWSSFAVMWLTRTPPEALGHVSAALVPAEVRLRLRAQGDADWRRFLAARAGELRPGGRLVVLVAGPPEKGFAGTRPLMETLAKSLRQLVANGRLSEAARKRAFIPTLARFGTDLRAPFAEGTFAGLALEEQEDWPDFPDQAWERYRGDGDVATLTEAYLGFFQATFLPFTAAQPGAIRYGIGAPISRRHAGNCNPVCDHVRSAAVRSDSTALDNGEARLALVLAGGLSAAAERPGGSPTIGMQGQVRAPFGG